MAPCKIFIELLFHFTPLLQTRAAPKKKTDFALLLYARRGDEKTFAKKEEKIDGKIDVEK